MEIDAGGRSVLPGFIDVHNHYLATAEQLASVDLRFPAVANRTYSVQYRDSLSSGNWQSLADVPADSADRVFTFTDFLPPGLNSRFYRVVTPSTP